LEFSEILFCLGRFYPRELDTMRTKSVRLLMRELSSEELKIKKYVR